jgi:hypothetical protein
MAHNPIQKHLSASQALKGKTKANGSLGSQAGTSSNKNVTAPTSNTLLNKTLMALLNSKGGSSGLSGAKSAFGRPSTGKT